MLLPPSHYPTVVLREVVRASVSKTPPSIGYVCVPSRGWAIGDRASKKRDPFPKPFEPLLLQGVGVGSKGSQKENPQNEGGPNNPILTNPHNTHTHTHNTHTHTHTHTRDAPARTRLAGLEGDDHGPAPKLQAPELGVQRLCQLLHLLRGRGKNNARGGVAGGWGERGVVGGGGVGSGRCFAFFRGHGRRFVGPVVTQVQVSQEKCGGKSRHHRGYKNRVGFRFNLQPIFRAAPLMDRPRVAT